MESKYLGILVEVKENGTVTIPTSILEGAGIEVGKKVEAFANKGVVYLRAIEEFCNICNMNGQVYDLDGIKVCHSCKDKMSKSLKNI